MKAKILELMYNLEQGNINYKFASKQVSDLFSDSLRSSLPPINKGAKIKHQEFEHKIIEGDNLNNPPAFEVVNYAINKYSNPDFIELIEPEKQ